jgi:hypothetical protein
MVRFLWVYLENAGSDLKFDMFVDKFERFMNQDESGMKRFVFEIYDSSSKDKITEEGLFKFMSTMTNKVPGAK